MKKPLQLRKRGFPVKNITFRQVGLAMSLVALLTLCSLTLTWSKSELRLKKNQSQREEIEVPLYLPDTKYVRLVTLGFDTFVSRILWFNTVNYFGKQYLSGNDYQWLYHNCKLVTELDENATHAFEFCGTLLSWMAQEPERSNEILTHAIQSHPETWRFRYLRGFNYWYFLSRKDLAKEDFKIASKLPNAPRILASLATRLMIAEDDPQTAIAFLRDLIENTRDENVKQALGEKLKRAFISRDKRILAKAVGIFDQMFGRKPFSLSELVEKGIINRLPVEPFGGEYLFDRETGEIRTSSGEKELQFLGKTAKTGIYRYEIKR
jgi:tetratricopeptide (TPR) repeat protein